MTRIHAAAAVAAVLTLGHAASASAQTAPPPDHFLTQPRVIQIDPLDPMAAMAARMATRRDANTVVMTTVPGATFEDPYETYRAQYQQYLVRYAQYAGGAEQQSGQSAWTAAVANISTGMQLTHGALDVYQHAIEVNALKNSLRPSN